MRDKVYRAPRDKYVRLTITISFSSTIRSLARLRPLNHNHKGKQFMRGTPEWERLKVLRKKKSVLILIFQICVFLFFFFFCLMLLFSSSFPLIFWILFGFSFLSSYFFFCLQPFYGSFCWKVEPQLLLKTVSVSNRKNLGLLEK